MPREDNFNAHFSCALDDRIKVVNLEPQQHSIAIRLVIGIADASMMVFDFEAVQLKHKLAI